MTGMRLRAASGPLRSLLEAGTVTGLSDVQLLERFNTRTGSAAELAFAAIIERHGKLVMRVCRTVLANEDDAHDAFQATFLVLIRRARSIRDGNSLASWLHGVALRVARTSRAASSRRNEHERRFASMGRAPEERLETDDLRRVVQEELEHLPERYRVAVVLCDLEGFSQEQAAQQLDWPVGTVKSRLFRARERLRERLSRRGLAPSTLGLLGQSSLVPRSLVNTTVSAAKGFATGRVASGLTRTAAETLAQGALSMLRFKRMVQVVSGMALLGSIAGGTMLFAQQKVIPTPAAPVEKPQIAYEILSFSMSGLEWRDTLNADLHFVDQKDNGTVWSLAGRDQINRVLALAPGAKLLPKPTAFEGVPFRLGIEDETKYVSNLEVIRSNDGGIAFKPAIKTLVWGRHVDLRGTLRSDGIQVKGSLEDRELLSFTTQKVTVEGLNPQGQKTRVAGQVQVPELRIDKVEGEWLIPTEGALLVSLGIRAGHKNILGYGTTTQEHLFLITARQITPKEISDAVAGVKPPASIRPNGN